jgi:hypothetical protein
MLTFMLRLCVVCVLVAGVPARAATIDATDSGWYNVSGTHLAQIDNYIVGAGNGTLYHNFFVFDLTGVTGLVVSASLELYNPDNALPALKGYISPDATETYTLYDVSTPIATVQASNVGAAGQAVYNDLGSGVDFGQATVSAADNGSIVSIVLNAAGLDALNAALGGQFALGGALTTLGGAGTEYVFGFSVGIGNPDVRRLVIETTSAVPEPALLLLLGPAIAVALRRRARR